MTGFSRRTVIKGAAATTATLSIHSFAWAAEVPASVFVFDGRFGAAAALALNRSARGAAVIDPREEDLGLAWRGKIPRFLARQGTVVEGVTLWSDLLICRTFAREHGLALAGARELVGSGLLRWTMVRSGMAG